MIMQDLRIDGSLKLWIEVFLADHKARVEGRNCIPKQYPLPLVSITDNFTTLLANFATKPLLMNLFNYFFQLEK
jgi:hypothetical protein